MYINYDPSFALDYSVICPTTDPPRTLTSDPNFDLRLAFPQLISADPILPDAWSTIRLHYIE